VQRRLPILVRHILYNLRGGFLVRPMTIVLVLGCAGMFWPWLESSYPVVSDWVPRLLFPSHADPVLAQGILEDIATSIMTVVSIVFAILLMTLTLASMQFSPRIIVSFAKDRVTQWTLGIFLGTFAYCMAALPSARSRPVPFEPVATVLGAMILAVACVAWLLFFIYHISHAISVNQIVDRIAAETEIVVDEMMPLPRRPVRIAAPPEEAIEWQTAVPSEVSGYLRVLDIHRLVDLAKTYRVKIRVARRVGQFIPEGIPLVEVSKADRVTADAADDIRAAFDFGPFRTLQQDVEFGVLQIVDIALKAISPAVNDPSTAIGCIDQLSRILIRFVSREPPEELLYDPPGVLRVSIPWIDFDRLLESAFEQIRMYSKSDVAVSLRLLRALRDVASGTSDREFRRSLLASGKRVVAGCAERLGEDEMRHLRVRLLALEKVADRRP
jgi:uncharacterized membrane protein